MNLLKVSAANRRKVLAASTESKPPNVYYRYNHGLLKYEFVVEIYDNKTGDKYQLTGGQLEWEAAINKLHSGMEEAPAS